MALRIMIVGGGIGGLNAAIALRNDGHDVVVLERAPHMELIGAGITLFANAMRALDRLGVGDAVRAQGAAARWSAILRADGRELAQVPSDLLDGAVALHRGDLQAILRQAAGDVRLGVEITSVEQDEQGVVVRGDGVEERGEVLIGADGLNSVVRRAVAPAGPRYAGYTAWRGISPLTVDAGRMTETWGVGERFGLVDIGQRTYWFATKNAHEAEPDEPAGGKAELQRRFSRWHEPIAAVLDTTDASAILRNDVYYLESLPRWSSGRVVLLGDAAHATTPGVGQGAAQAIEDAVALAEQIAGNSDPAEAFARYESLRRPRAEYVQKISRRVDKAAQLASPVASRIRDAIVRLLPESAQRRQLEPLIHHEP
jgi:2-polyprenyl-6-methoxyphenol hydroxylase-like FAD-dependent oxidoreductase